MEIMKRQVLDKALLKPRFQSHVAVIPHRSATGRVRPLSFIVSDMSQKR